jgi:hypothetical protein
MFLRAWLSGLVVYAYALPSLGGVLRHEWPAIWTICAGCSALVLLFYLLVFADDGRSADIADRAPEAQAARS